jgi:hypothetical protein
VREEKKTKTTIDSKSGKKQEVSSHLRKIGDKSITTTTENGIKKVKTEMTAK